MSQIDLRDKEKQSYVSPQVVILELKTESVIAVSPTAYAIYFLCSDQGNGNELYEW